MKSAHRIPIGKVNESLRECLFSALNFWQAGVYVQEKLGPHIAVGLWILGIEEVGKYTLLKEAAAASASSESFEISVRDFTSHAIKSEKGQALFQSWGIDLKETGIALTKETREELWYVSWDNKAQEFKRDFSSLEPQPITRVAILGEMMRRGIVKMNELLNRTSLS